MASYCENCGAALESGRKFCSQCGAMQAQSGPAAGAPAPQAQQMPSASSSGGFGGQPPPPPKAGGQTIALYDQDYDQAPPSRPPQAQPQQPFAPKAQQEVFAPKPQAVYPPQAPPAYPPRPAYPVQAAAPVKTAASDSLILTLGLLLLASIPILGLIPAILFGFKQDSGYRGVLMKSMIVINVIWTAVLVILFYQFYSVLTQVADVNIYWFWQ